MTQAEDLMRLSDIDTEDCVLWPHRLNERGYGTINQQGKNYGTHRLSLIRHTNTEPDRTVFALHSCLNRHCLNPKHLRWGTAKENAADRIAGPNHNYGQRHGRSRLTEQDVVAIRNSTDSTGVLGRKYGVSPSTIREAAKGGTWRHLSTPPRQLERKKATAKLTQLNAYMIREMARQGVQQKLIAEHFNVNQSTISDVVRGKSWRD